MIAGPESSAPGAASAACSKAFRDGTKNSLRKRNAIRDDRFDEDIRNRRKENSQKGVILAADEIDLVHSVTHDRIQEETGSSGGRSGRVGVYNRNAPGRTTAAASNDAKSRVCASR